MGMRSFSVCTAAFGVLLLAACTASPRSASSTHPTVETWPTASPVITGAEQTSSAGPGAIQTPLQRCGSGGGGTPTALRVSVPLDGTVARPRLSDGDTLSLLLPQRFLPLHIAHGLMFSPSVCLLTSTRHGEWARLLLRVDRAAPGVLLTDYIPRQWNGRPLVTL